MGWRKKGMQRSPCLQDREMEAGIEKKVLLNATSQFLQRNERQRRELLKYEETLESRSRNW